MKQRINLYQPSLHPVQERFSLPGLVASSSLLLLMIAAVAGALQYQLQQQQQQTNKIVTAVQQKSEELANLQQALENRQPEPNLVQQAEQLNAEIAQKQQLLRYLTADQQVQPPQFAAVMHQLSTQDLPQFWLRSFRLGKAGVEFEGVTKDAAQVPRWLKLLGQSSQFSGQHFSTVMLQPHGQDYLQFRVSNLDSASTAEGAE